MQIKLCFSEWKTVPQILKSWLDFCFSLALKLCLEIEKSWHDFWLVSSLLWTYSWTLKIAVKTVGCQPLNVSWPSLRVGQHCNMVSIFAHSLSTPSRHQVSSLPQLLVGTHFLIWKGFDHLEFSFPVNIFNLVDSHSLIKI